MPSETTTQTAAAYQRPPWPAAVAAALAYAALALSSGAFVPLAALGLSLAASYGFKARFENETLTKWTLRVVAYGVPIFFYWVTATKDESSFFDVRYLNSFALAAAAETALQFWRREPTGGARAPFTVFLSAMVFLIGCSVFDDASHYLWYLAPAFFLFWTLALPGFRRSSGGSETLRSALLPMLAALLLGGVTHAAFIRYKNALNLLGASTLPMRRMSPSMGMSAQPILGSSFTLRDSLTRVLRIHALGPDPYLRGMTFDTYGGRAWGPPLEARVFLTLPPQQTLGSRPRARFVRLDDDIGLLFAPLHAAAIAPEDTHPVDWAARTDGPLRTPPADTAPLTYDIAEDDRVQGSAGLLDAPPTPDERGRDLTVPADIDPRVVAEAHQITGRLRTPQQKIDAVVGFLRTNNHYSLTIAPGPGEPISSFILQHKAAHCEYFASAAVVLLRAGGVPTRYVSGYYAHESDGRGWTLVRQRDAHAWAESWIAGAGWVTVDATPGSGRPDALAGPIPWYWRVWEKVQDVLGAVRTWVLTASWGQKGTVFALLVLGLLVPQAYRYWQRQRAFTPGFRYFSPDAALQPLSDRFEALLARRGIPCPPNRTWAGHLAAQRVSDGAFYGFVQGYEQARFGPPPMPADIRRLQCVLRSLENKPLEKKVETIA